MGGFYFKLPLSNCFSGCTTLKIVTLTIVITVGLSSATRLFLNTSPETFALIFFFGSNGYLKLSAYKKKETVLISYEAHKWKIVFLE